MTSRRTPPLVRGTPTRGLARALDDLAIAQPGIAYPEHDEALADQAVEIVTRSIHQRTGCTQIDVTIEDERRF